MPISWKFAASVLALCLAASSPGAIAETFYAASVRTQASARADAAGTLYTIDPNTAAATVVAPIRLGGVHPIGVTGLAVHPRTSVFYGITGRFSTAAPHSLVTIDPDNGKAALVGALGTVGSDIGFAPDGTLYVWLPEINQLGTLDLATGKANAKGPSGIAEAARSGAIAIASSDRAYVAATGATGTLDKLDLRTGTRTLGAQLTGAPFPDFITNLSFSPSGKLFAVNANSGAPADTTLVTIDPESGVITPVGALPKDIEGLIFAERPGKFSFKGNWSLISSSLAGLTLIAIFAWLSITSRRNK